MVRFQKSHGIGRAMGLWGIYEGETSNGKRDERVYGRSILRDGSYYIGYQ